MSIAYNYSLDNMLRGMRTHESKRNLIVQIVHIKHNTGLPVIQHFNGRVSEPQPEPELLFIP